MEGAFAKLMREADVLQREAVARTEHMLRKAKPWAPPSVLAALRSLGTARDPRLWRIAEKLFELVTQAEMERVWSRLRKDGCGDADLAVIAGVAAGAAIHGAGHGSLSPAECDQSATKLWEAANALLEASANVPHINVTAEERRAVYSLFCKAEATLENAHVDRFGRNDGNQDTRAFIVLVGVALTKACGKSSPSIIARMAKVLLGKEIDRQTIYRRLSALHSPAQANANRQRE